MANYATTSLKLTDTYVNTLPYNTCSTAEGTAAKTVSAGDFSLETGAMVVVKFTTTNTASNPTLNVSSTGAKAIYYNGAAITAGYLKANKVYQFIYNGTQWDLVGDVDTDTNTDTNTTYSLSKSGSTITLTGSDGSTTSVTDSDTNTHYTTGITAGASGTTTNSSATNPYVKIKDDSTHRGQIRLVGGGATTVSSDANGNITISSTDENTGTITGVSANGTSVATSGVANIPAASTSKYGVTKLSTSTSSTSTALAATPSAVKAAYDLANSKAPTASPAFTGTPTTAAGTDYTTKKLRNVMFGTSAPTSSTTWSNGDIFIVYAP